MSLSLQTISRQYNLFAAVCLKTRFICSRLKYICGFSSCLRFLPPHFFVALGLSNISNHLIEKKIQKMFCRLDYILASKDLKQQRFRGFLGARLGAWFWIPQSARWKKRRKVTLQNGLALNLVKRNLALWISSRRISEICLSSMVKRSMNHVSTMI